jgi:hypothetical protein
MHRLYNAAAMNLLGRQSLSSFFKLLFDVAFHVTCIVGALLVVLALVASRIGTRNVSVSLPVPFEIDPVGVSDRRGGQRGGRSHRGRRR